MTRALRLASRTSALALAQASGVAEAITAATDIPVTVVPVHADGDLLSASPGALGDTGVFVERLRMALLAGQADLVLHSAADVPLDVLDGVVTAAVLERGDVREAFVAREGQRLRTLPKGARVGISWPRQARALQRLRRDLDIVEVRGHVDDRLAEVEQGRIDGLVLPSSAMDALAQSDLIVERFAPTRVAPALGAGLWVLEARADQMDDSAIAAAVGTLHHVSSGLQLLAEQIAGHTLHATPADGLGAWSVFDDDGITVHLHVDLDAGHAHVEHHEAWRSLDTEQTRRNAAIAAGRGAAKALRSEGAWQARAGQDRAGEVRTA